MGKESKKAPVAITRKPGRQWSIQGLRNLHKLGARAGASRPVSPQATTLLERETVFMRQSEVNLLADLFIRGARRYLASQLGRIESKANYRAPTGARRVVSGRATG